MSNLEDSGPDSSSGTAGETHENSQEETTSGDTGSSDPAIGELFDRTGSASGSEDEGDAESAGREPTGEGPAAESTRTDRTDASASASDDGGSFGDDVDSLTAEPPEDDDRHRSVREKPERTDRTEQGLFSIPNYAQDLVDIEFVLEEDDDLTPDGVDGSGLVVVDDETYVGIMKVRPRSWSIHTAEKKAEIVSTFQSAVLAPLEFPVQIVSYPTKFDISDHISKLEDAIEDERYDDSKLIRMGRRLYPNWMTSFIEQNDMKQRRFYVIVSISADMISQFENDNSGVAETIENKFPPLSPLVSPFTDTDGSDVTERQCVRELNTRLGRIQSGLQRLDVEGQRLRDRQEAMSVLYHYYNNEQPQRNFETGPYTVFDESAGGDR